MPRKAEPFRKTVIRFCLPSGKRCRKDHPKSQRIVTKTETYYASIHGKVESLGSGDLSQAWAELRRRQRGEPSDRDAGRPLAELVEMYRKHIEDGGASREWALTVSQRLSKLFGLAGWLLGRHLDPDGLLGGLAALQRQGASNQTRNHYLTHARAFSAWLGRRTGRDTLRGVGRPLPPAADPRHPRRCPTREEVGFLFAWLAGPGAGNRHRMTAKQRAMFYMVAMATGFRLGEIRSLRRESFDLTNGTVTVRAAYSKNRREDTQPLPIWLVEDLQKYFADGGECWGGWRYDHPGCVLRDDLAGAGIPYRTDEGFFDLHSLRHFYVSTLARQPGISVKTLQVLARHSTPTLTIQIYSHARKADLYAAVDDLPRLGPSQERPGRGCQIG